MQYKEMLCKIKEYLIVYRYLLTEYIINRLLFFFFHIITAGESVYNVKPQYVIIFINQRFIKSLFIFVMHIFL